MDPANPFYRQLSLLVQLLPIVGHQTCFALKGGTAINLFVRDLPRLSVDIDLAYLPMANRDQALAGIDSALKAISAEIDQRLPECRVTAQPDRETGTLLKLGIARPDAMVKIEVTPVLRGAVYEPETRAVRSSVEARLGFAEVLLLSFNDLYAGKLCATLDRQHPRDLYDTLLLLDNEGISRDLIRAFIVYLIGHNRPMGELLAPRAKSLAGVYESEFRGMAFDDVGIDRLEATLPRLVDTLHDSLTDADRAFLLSFKEGDPDWARLGLPHIEQLPSVRWKLLNLDRMDKNKRREAIGNLEAVLFGGKRT
ncbi:MAG TPA: nucleotidyl transferase AbiEii/AbiGii toxin family protein [Gammaproteobacteria bacterium]|nr:nucleotidyl transferase AbiEii/AbiGii toxin family protein [Gammaproteobacteria bacterium]